MASEKAKKCGRVQSAMVEYAAERYGALEGPGMLSCSRYATGFIDARKMVSAWLSENSKSHQVNIYPLK